MSGVTQATQPIRAFAALKTGVLTAPRHWRMLLLWLLASAVPALIAALPLMSALNSAFGASPHAADIDAGRNLPLLIEGLMTVTQSSAILSISSHVAITLACAALLSPWISGMLVASLREARPMYFGELVFGGLREYGRQFRLLLVLAIPAVLFLVAASMLSKTLNAIAHQATLASSARHLEWAATGILLLTMATVHWVLELARAEFARDVGLRAAWRAAVRGITQLFQRPFASVFIHLATVLPALLIGPAAALAALKLPALAGLLMVQLAGLLLGALRAARLIAYSKL